MAKQRWITTVLAISLAINLLAAGAVLGRFIKGERSGRPPLAWASKELDASSRERLRPILQPNAEATRALRRQIREASDAVRGAIRAEPFDSVALTDALAELRAVSLDYQTAVHSLAVESLAELPAEERERFGAMLLRPGPQDGRRPHGGPRPPGGGRPEHRPPPPGMQRPAP